MCPLNHNYFIYETATTLKTKSEQLGWEISNGTKYEVLVILLASANYSRKMQQLVMRGLGKQ